MTDIPDLARLSAESGWVRALARRLVRDAHLADDLAPDALRAARDARERVTARGAALDERGR